MNMRILWVLVAIGGMTIIAVVLGIGVLMMAGGSNFLSQPTVTTTATTTPEPTAPIVATASLAGFVWHDMCAWNTSTVISQGSVPLGCVPKPDGAAVMANSMREDGEPGIDGVEITIGLGACPSYGLMRTTADNGGSFRFDALVPGTYCVSIDPHSGVNASILPPGQWTAPMTGMGAAFITLSLAEGERREGLNFGWDFDLLPAPDPSPVPSAVPTSSNILPTSSGCVDRVDFVKDVTIPDNTRVEPGKSFEKIWRLKNSGTCTWTTSYALMFVSGDRMGAVSPIPLTGNISPGSTVDLKVNLTAPSANGTYRGEWKLKNAYGVQFGLGEKSDKPFWVQVVVGVSGAGGAYSWQGEYFNNIKLEGKAALVRYEPMIDFNWKTDAPDRSLPADNFSVRWTGKAEFKSAVYRFRILVDDGARLWVDKHLVLDAWKDGATREVAVDVLLTRGSHDISLEYYERYGEARVRLKWEEIASPTYSDWKGEYWTNPELKGTPLFVRNDGKIDFQWGKISPATGIPADGYSVRWTRTVNFDAGTYRFGARADDGIRINLDGKRILNEWHLSDGSTTYAVERTLSAGKHDIVIEYFENTGNALVKVWWEKIQPTTTPTSTLTTTPTSTKSPTPSETAKPADTLTPTPTETPTPTPTETPTPTPSSTEVSKTEPELVYDLRSRLCDANWRSSASVLPCPGEEGSSMGAVYVLQHQSLENGDAAGARNIVLYPERVDRGWIEGTFPAFTIRAGDRFRTTLGCVLGYVECEVGVELSYRDPDGELKNLGTWLEVYDAKVRVIDLDLTPLAGKTVELILLVYAEKASAHNSLIWVQPGVWR